MKMMTVYMKGKQKIINAMEKANLLLIQKYMKETGKMTKKMEKGL